MERGKVEEKEKEEGNRKGVREQVRVLDMGAGRRQKGKGEM